MKTTSRDIAQEITDRLVAALDEGIIPWERPWSVGASAPRNLDGRLYRGINVWLLASAPYASPFWGTFRQIKSKGGSVRKGERGTAVVFWKFIDGKDKETGEKVRIPLLRHYVVFNVEQTDGLDLSAFTVDAPTKSFDPIARAEEIVSGWSGCPPILYGGDRACYAPTLDVVRMPARESFRDEPSFYSTLFHELTHATGHESRLARTFGESFGTETYAREELVAEFGASMLSGHAGFVERTIESSKAYVQSWAAKLRSDKRLAISAAAAAQKAVDLILGTTFEDEVQDEDEKAIAA